MATQTPDYVNEFFARGIVLSIERGKFGSRVLTLLVKERRNELRMDISLENGVARGIGRKDRVVVYGYTRGFSYHNESLNKDSNIMFFAGTKVERETPELAKRFGNNLGLFYPEPVFRSFISGKVVQVVERNEKNAWAQLIVETCGGGKDLRASRVIMRYYTAGQLPLFDYKEGDIICARLSANTPERKMNNGKTFRFQNLIVEDIAYLFKMPREMEPQKAPAFDIDLGLGGFIKKQNQENRRLEEAEREAAQVFMNDDYEAGRGMEQSTIESLFATSF